MPVETELRRAVREALREKGITLKEACAQAEITTATVQNWMNGLGARAAGRTRFFRAIGLTEEVGVCPTCGKPR